MSLDNTATKQSLYQPLYPEVYHFNREFLVPEAQAALERDGSVDTVAYSEQKGVLAFPLLQEDFCQRLNDEIEHLENWYQQQGIELEAPNSLHRRGAAARSLCLEKLLEGLFHEVVKPLAAKYFRDYEGENLQGYYGFTADYLPDDNESLEYHIDASNVTMNLCLSRDFAGSELCFAGERCAEHLESQPMWFEQYTYYHRMGHAVIHTGMHRHAVNPIREGKRRNLIMWCRSGSDSFFNNDETARSHCIEHHP